MAPYGIATDRERRVLRADLRGFWDISTVTAYLAELGVAAAQVSRGGAPSWWLIDISKSHVQSREVTDLMGKGLPRLFPPAMTLAVVMNTSLPAVQARRVVPDARHRHFAKLSDAESWLFAQGMPL